MLMLPVLATLVPIVHRDCYGILQAQKLDVAIKALSGERASFLHILQVIRAARIQDIVGHNDCSLS